MNNIIHVMPQHARVGSPILRGNLSQTSVLELKRIGARVLALVAHSTGYQLERDGYRYVPAYYAVRLFDGVKPTTHRFCTCDKARAHFEELCR